MAANVWRFSMIVAIGRRFKCTPLRSFCCFTFFLWRGRATRRMSATSAWSGPLPYWVLCWDWALPPPFYGGAQHPLVLDSGVGRRKKKENCEVFAVLPSWMEEKEERFLPQKVTVTTWKMVENFEFWGRTFLVMANKIHTQWCSKTNQK